ncbi:MAG TPA: hypothetical protein VHJ20_13575, partial [Polyangia bacterium]|nr:hypothetical protein [Polyangia bacterium]
MVAFCAGALGCNSSSGPPISPQCLHTSDCKNPLQVCSLGYCVKACATSADCPNAGQRCIKATIVDADGGVVTGTTCEAPELASCTYTSQCKDPLVCSVIDGQCRDGCVTNVDCPEKQVCTSDTHVCADPSVDTNYDPVTMTLKATDGRVKVDAAAGGSGGGAGGVADGGVG